VRDIENAKTNPLDGKGAEFVDSQNYKNKPTERMGLRRSMIVKSQNKPIKLSKLKAFSVQRVESLLIAN